MRSAKAINEYAHPRRYITAHYDHLEPEVVRGAIDTHWSTRIRAQVYFGTVVVAAAYGGIADLMAWGSHLDWRGYLAYGLAGAVAGGSLNATVSNGAQTRRIERDLQAVQEAEPVDLPPARDEGFGQLGGEPPEFYIS